MRTAQFSSTRQFDRLRKQASYVPQFPKGAEDSCTCSHPSAINSAATLTLSHHLGSHACSQNEKPAHKNTRERSEEAVVCAAPTCAAHMDSLSSVFGHTTSNPCLVSFSSIAANTRGVSGLNSSSGAFTMASPSPAANNTKQNFHEDAAPLGRAVSQSAIPSEIFATFLGASGKRLAVKSGVCIGWI